MGFFSRKKTYRDLQFARVIDDDNLPNVIGQAITEYVLDKNNTKDLADLMLEYGWKATNVKWNAAYRYAKKNGKYVYGTPTSTLVAETDFTGAESLEEVLQNLTGSTNLSYVYSKFVEQNFRHAMYQLLISNYGYTPTDNILTGLSKTVGQTCFLYDATNYITPNTKTMSDPTGLEHWGYSPTSGATMSRSQNLSASDTPDGVSQTGENYARVEYTYNYAGIVKTTVTTTTKTTTVTKTPDGNGGYTETTDTKSNPETTESTDWNGFTDPDNLVSKIEVGHSTESNTQTGTPSTTSKTDESTGVITEVTTQTDVKTDKDSYGLTIVAYFDMSFGVYDYNPDTIENINTTTVLDDKDSGDYDPNAVLQPSGESVGEDSDTFMVCFTYPNSDGSTHISYFTYTYGSGSYPDLDGITGTTVSDFGQLYPRIFFRLDGNNLFDDKYKNTEEYASSKRMGSRIEMPWVDTGTEIISGMSSLNKIRDVYISLCVPANTTNSIEERYIFEYLYTFYNLRKAIDPTLVAPTLADWNLHEGSLIISKDNQSTMTIQADQIGYQKITGTIGGQGSTASGYDATGGYHWYQYQATNNQQYEEIRVWGLKSGAQVGKKTLYKDGTDENLMIPLDRAFRNLFGAHKRELLYARAAHLVIGTEYTVKTKWYATGLFKVVVTIVAIVLAWWTGGASLTLIAALTAAAETIAITVALSLASKYIFSKLGTFGEIVGIAVAIIAIAYGGYQYATNGAGALQVTAQEMMQVANVGFTASQASIQGEMAKIQKKVDRLNDTIEEDKSILEDANDQLNTNSNALNGYNFFGAIAQYTYLGESPQSFYGRTLNTNIGLVALQSPAISISQSLSLPTSEETMMKLQQSLYPAPVEGLDIIT